MVLARTHSMFIVIRKDDTWAITGTYRDAVVATFKSSLLIFILVSTWARKVQREVRDVNLLSNSHLGE